MHVGIIGHGTWLPSTFMSAEDISAATGIPQDVITLKFGVRRKPVSSPVRPPPPWVSMPRDAPSLTRVFPAQRWTW